MMRKRKNGPASIDTAITDVFSRELGDLNTKRFTNCLTASKDLVLRLDVYRKLERHRGCVNTVSFSEDGDHLISGSDDRGIIIWDWQSGDIKLSFHSGHVNNVFQAMMMPYTQDRSIVSCAADGQVRHAQILESNQVDTKLLRRHRGRVHKLALEPGSPYIFYSCGEDGVVHHFDLRIPVGKPLLTCQRLADRGAFPFVGLNTIAVDPRNPNLFAVGGSDEFARLYDIRKSKSNGSTYYGEPVDYFCASHLIGKKLSISGLAFSDQSELLVSYNDEFIYLFTKEMGQGPYIPEACEASVSDTAFYERYAGLVDEPQDLAQATSSTKGTETEKDAASLCKMKADVEDRPQVYKGHTNRETVKGVNFFGPKCEYIVSGSDCGRIFIWEKKRGELIRVMEADKHVVNCIESHPHSTVLASSGIENDIKIWTPKALHKASLPTDVGKVSVRRIPFSYFIDPVDYEYGSAIESSEEDSNWEVEESCESCTDSEDDEGDDISIEFNDHEDDDRDVCEESSDGNEHNNRSSDDEDC